MTAGAPYRASRNVVCYCKYHVVCYPKYRRPVLDEEAAERLKALLRRLAQECQAELIGLEVVPDHVHLPSAAQLARLRALLRAFGPGA